MGPAAFVEVVGDAIVAGVLGVRRTVVDHYSVDNEGSFRRKLSDEVAIGHVVPKLDAVIETQDLGRGRARTEPAPANDDRQWPDRAPHSPPVPYA